MLQRYPLSQRPVIRYKYNTDEGVPGRITKFVNISFRELLITVIRGNVEW